MTPESRTWCLILQIFSPKLTIFKSQAESRIFRPKILECLDSRFWSVWTPDFGSLGSKRLLKTLRHKDFTVVFINFSFFKLVFILLNSFGGKLIFLYFLFALYFLLSRNSIKASKISLACELKIVGLKGFCKSQIPEMLKLLVHFGPESHQHWSSWET